MTDKQAQQAQLAMLAVNVRTAGERVFETEKELAQATENWFSAIKQYPSRDVRTAAAQRNAVEVGVRLVRLEKEYIKHQKKALAAKRGLLA
jgi:hypothetical protein